MSELNLKVANDSLKFMGDLEPKQYKQLWSKVLNLTKDPRPNYSEHLSGNADCFRIAAGEFRCVYKILPGAIHVLIVERRNDDKVYQKLKRIS
jgi:mRNA interferase RelE/StbE